MMGSRHSELGRAAGFLASAMLVQPVWAQGSPADLDLRFAELPALPDAHGFAGMYVGVSGGALLAAGGTNFPDQPFTEGGSKRWYDHVFILTDPDGQWRRLEERLPRPLAHGVAVTYGDAVICAGGAGPEAHHAEVFALRWDGQKLEITPLPSLPAPSAFMAGALAGDSLYLAGGQRTPDAAEGTADFWSLDLSSAPDPVGWRTLASWPGAPRHRAVAAAIGDSFVLISGVQSEADEAGRIRWLRPLLKDAYRYAPGSGGEPGTWTSLASLPRAAAAAASPAPVTVNSQILIFGGVEDALLDADPRDYPGFPRDVVVYDAGRDAWSSQATMPPDASRVVPGVARWHGRHVFVSGETAPGRRSPRAITVTPEPAAPSPAPATRIDR